MPFPGRQRHAGRVAMQGVNLPAHLVILKGTKRYGPDGYTEYERGECLQMIGRAGPTPSTPRLMRVTKALPADQIAFTTQLIGSLGLCRPPTVRRQRSGCHHDPVGQGREVRRRLERVRGARGPGEQGRAPSGDRPPRASFAPSDEDPALAACDRLKNVAAALVGTATLHWVASGSRASYIIASPSF